VQTGRFIVFEGLEGSGKTTNLAYAVDWLAQQGIDVITTREPGGTVVAEKIRGVLLANHEESIDPMSELWLMFAARMQHVQQVIKPALASGKWVLCDRFLEASYAYQGGGRGIPEHYIDTLADLIREHANPDCTLYLDISLETSVQRITQRGSLDRFEQEGRDFFQRIHQVYRRRAEASQTHHWVDAELELPQVQSQVIAILETLIP